MMLAGFALSAQAEDISMQSGFNLMSYPVEVPDALTCSALVTQLGANQIRRLDNVSQQFEDCLTANFEIESGVGYIVRRTDPTVITFTGELSCPLINLLPGINLIGVPTPSAGMGCHTLLQALGDHSVVSAVQRYNTDSGKYESCAYDENAVESLPQGFDFPIRSGEVYFAHMKQAVDGIALNDEAQCSDGSNNPPVITSIPVISSIVDSDYHYQVTADDLDDDPLFFTLSEAPLGMAIDSESGLITWLPLNEGSFEVEIEVNDGQGGQDSQTFQLISGFGAGVSPPQLNPIGDRTAPLGSTLTVQLTAISDKPVTFNAEPMPLLEGMMLNSSTGLFNFTPSITQIGSHSITFVAHDGRFSDSETISITVPAIDGITRLQGKVLTENSVALANVRLDISGVETVTDMNGDFLLDNLPVSGDVRLLVDGSTVDPALGIFATVPEIINLIEGADNQLVPAIVLLPLDVASADPVDPAITSVITSNRVIEGLKIFEPVTLTIPPGSAIDDATGEPFVGDIHISRIADPTQGPRPLPDDIDLSVYIAIQPFGVTYPDPVPISFPNIEGFAPGSLLDFFALNHETGAFEKIGEGTVSADGKTVDSIGGVVKSNSWHGIVPQAPVVENSADQDLTEPCSASNEVDGGCAFNMETGNLSEKHRLPVYYSLQAPRIAQLVYNSVNANPRPIIPLESGFGNFAPPPDTMSMLINVGGIQLGEELYSAVNVVPSTIRTQFEATRPGIQFDGMSFPTGIYDYAIDVNCHFPISRRSETLNGDLIIQNERESPFGAGWTLQDLQRIDINAQGLALITEGDDTSYLFRPIDGTNFESPFSDFSTLTRLADNTFKRRMKDGTVYLFDTQGKLVSKADRNNNVTTYTYDAEGRLTLITDPVGKFYKFAYFAGRIKSITDPANRITQFEHDSEGNLIAIIEPNGDRRTFEYENGTHLLSAQNDQRGNRKEYGYDFAGRIRQARLPDGSITELEPGIVKGLLDPDSGLGTPENPGPAPLLLKEVSNTFIDHNGNLTLTETDPRNAPLKITDAVGRTTLMVRDDDSNPTRATRPNESVIDRSFDDLGNVLTSRELFNGALTTFTYDEFSLVTSFTNPNNHTTTINRDNSGNPVEIINHLNHTTLIDYDNRGLITRIEDSNGLVTTIDYNAQGLAETITETPPAASPGNIRITTLSYDAAGQNTQMITPEGIVLDMLYDSKGRLFRITDNLNQTIEYSYDAHDNLVATDIRNAAGDLARTVANAFDTRNRLTEIRAPHDATEDSIVQRGLDNNSNLVGLTDPNGAASTNIFDGEDRLVENIHRLNGVTRYQYDTNNRITKVTAPNGVVTEYIYDVLGRRLTETSADRGVLSYEYDLANNLTRVTDGRGITFVLAYDELERPISKTFPNTITGKNENVTYSYDNCPFGIGRICARTDESGSDAYEYDAFGNLVSMTHTELGVTYSMSYVYDGGDHVIQATYPSDRVVDHSRDGVRRLEAIDTQVNGLTQRIVGDIQYRGDNQMTRCTFGNDLIDERSYDLQGRLTHQVLKNIDDSVVDERTYSYDKNGNMLNRTTTPQNSDYQYDALDRLISDAFNGAIPADYSYDLNGNRLSRIQLGSLSETYSFYDESNQLAGLDIFSSPAANEPTFTDRELVYNDAGRLYQLYENGELKAEYIYNDLGQRTRKVAHDGEGNSATTIYHYDSMGYLITETDAAGNLIRDYIWSESMHPIAQIDRIGAGERLSYLHTDHLMTNRLATDSNQTVVWRWEGTAFGDTVPNEIGGLSINLRFPGQYFDQETGLFYNWNRYYDPELGRYITSDPIGLSGGLNTFGYANSSVLGSTDPLGLSSSDNFIVKGGKFLVFAGFSIGATTYKIVESQLKTGEFIARLAGYDCGKNCLSEVVNTHMTRNIYNEGNYWLSQVSGDSSIINNPEIVDAQNEVGDWLSTAFDIGSFGASDPSFVTRTKTLNQIKGFAKNSRYGVGAKLKWGLEYVVNGGARLGEKLLEIQTGFSIFSDFFGPTTAYAPSCENR